MSKTMSNLCLPDFVKMIKYIQKSFAYLQGSLIYLLEDNELKETPQVRCVFSPFGFTFFLGGGPVLQLARVVFRSNGQVMMAHS